MLLCWPRSTSKRKKKHFFCTKHGCAKSRNHGQRRKSHVRGNIRTESAGPVGIRTELGGNVARTIVVRLSRAFTVSRRHGTACCLWARIRIIAPSNSTDRDTHVPHWPKIVLRTGTVVLHAPCAEIYTFESIRTVPRVRKVWENCVTWGKFRVRSPTVLTRLQNASRLRSQQKGQVLAKEEQKVPSLFVSCPCLSTVAIIINC